MSRQAIRARPPTDRTGTGLSLAELKERLERYTAGDSTAWVAGLLNLKEEIRLMRLRA